MHACMHVCGCVFVCVCSYRIIFNDYVFVLQGYHFPQVSWQLIEVGNHVLVNNQHNYSQQQKE